MAHVREQLVQAVVTAVTGLTTTGLRVFRFRPQQRTLMPAQLPALRIYIDGDSANANGIHVPFYERPTQIRIEGVVQSTGQIDQTLNLISSEVEAALAAKVPLGTSSTLLFYRGCRFDESAEGDQPVGLVSMQFEALIETVHGVPDVSIEA